MIKSKKRIVCMTNKEYMLKQGINFAECGMCPLAAGLEVENIAGLECKDANYRITLIHQLINPFCGRCWALPAKVNGKYQMKFETAEMANDSPRDVTQAEYDKLVADGLLSPYVIYRVID